MMTVNQAIKLLQDAANDGWGDSPLCLDDASGYVSPFIGAAGLANADATGRVVILRCDGDSFEENGDPMDQTIPAWSVGTTTTTEGYSERW